MGFDEDFKRFAESSAKCKNCEFYDIDNENLRIEASYYGKVAICLNRSSERYKVGHNSIHCEFYKAKGELPEEGKLFDYAECMGPTDRIYRFVDITGTADIWRRMDYGYVTQEHYKRTIPLPVKAWMDQLSVIRKEEKKRRTNMNEKLQDIADYFEPEAQTRQTMKEMAELTQAINKLWRIDNGYYKEKTAENIEALIKNFIKEIGNVEIMIMQLKYIFKCEKEVRACMETVIEELHKKIQEGKA